MSFLNFHFFALHYSGSSQRIVICLDAVNFNKSKQTFHEINLRDEKKEREQNLAEPVVDFHTRNNFVKRKKASI